LNTRARGITHLFDIHERAFSALFFLDLFNAEFHALILALRLFSGKIYTFYLKNSLTASYAQVELFSPSLFSCQMSDNVIAKERLACFLYPGLKNKYGYEK
jgi:hypothetical protein